MNKTFWICRKHNLMFKLLISTCVFYSVCPMYQILMPICQFYTFCNFLESDLMTWTKDRQIQKRFYRPTLWPKGIRFCNLGEGIFRFWDFEMEFNWMILQIYREVTWTLTHYLFQFTLKLRANGGIKAIILDH